MNVKMLCRALFVLCLTELSLSFSLFRPFPSRTPSTSAIQISGFGFLEATAKISPQLKFVHDHQVQNRKTSLGAYSSDVSQNYSDGPEVDVVAKVVSDAHSMVDSVLDTKSQELQFNLLASCAGLDRGAAAGPVEREAVLRCVEALESSNAKPLEAFPAGLGQLDGMWRLIYSSALSPGSGSGGGAGKESLPWFQTPDNSLSISPFGRSSIASVGQVFQRIQSRRMLLDNIVEVRLAPPILSALLPQTVTKAVLTLEHQLRVDDDPARPNRVRIVLKTVTLRNQGGLLKNLRAPPLSLPVIDQLSEQGAGVFDTTYCAGRVRVARGDRGEVRVFVRDSAGSGSD